jgi:hypothetical protein
MVQDRQIGWCARSREFRRWCRKFPGRLSYDQVWHEVWILYHSVCAVGQTPRCWQLDRNWTDTLTSRRIEAAAFSQRCAHHRPRLGADAVPRRHSRDRTNGAGATHGQPWGGTTARKPGKYQSAPLLTE